ncbi:hypothetical protein AAY473_028332 [Plecturocebus cupreus]
MLLTCTDGDGLHELVPPGMGPHNQGQRWESPYVAEAGLKLLAQVILPPQPPKVLRLQVIRKAVGLVDESSAATCKKQPLEHAQSSKRCEQPERLLSTKALDNKRESVSTGSVDWLVTRSTAFKNHSPSLLAHAAQSRHGGFRQDHGGLWCSHEKPRASHDAPRFLALSFPILISSSQKNYHWSQASLVWMACVRLPGVRTELGTERGQRRGRSEKRAEETAREETREREPERWKTGGEGDTRDGEEETEEERRTLVLVWRTGYYTFLKTHIHHAGPHHLNEVILVFLIRLIINYLDVNCFAVDGKISIISKE